MRELVRGRWPALAGVVLGVLLLAGFALSGVDDGSGWRRSLLGVSPGAWVLALAVLATCLGIQLALNARVSLARERRLVQTAAALREASAQNERLATTDPLTSLVNRRAFFERFGIEFRRSLRYGRPLSVVMLDLDNFKQVNDRSGHPAGDRVLRDVSSVIAGEVRESDLLARYGGEELVLMLPETTREQAMIVAEKLREAVLGHEFRTGAPDGHDETVRLTLSAGVAAIPMSGPVTGEELVNRADRALYQAKRDGKNRVAEDDGRVVVVESQGTA